MLMIRKIVVLLASLSLLACTTTNALHSYPAQPRDLDRFEAGETVTLVLSDGRRVHATLVKITPSGVGTKGKNYSWQEVSEVRDRDFSLAKSTALFLLVVAAIGYGASKSFGCAFGGECDHEN